MSKPIELVARKTLVFKVGDKTLEVREPGIQHYQKFLAEYSEEKNEGKQITLMNEFLIDLGFDEAFLSELSFGSLSSLIEHLTGKKKA